MTELHNRITEDMKLHGFAKRTQESYFYAVSILAIINFSSFGGIKPGGLWPHAPPAQRNGTLNEWYLFI